MKFKQLFTTFALALAVITMSTSCSKDDDAPKPGDGDKIVAIFKSDIPYFHQIAYGIEVAAKEQGVKVEVFYGSGDVNYQSQLDILKGLDLTQLKGIIISPAQPEKLKDALTAISAQLPVVIVDTPIDVPCRAFIGTDNIAAGKNLAIQSADFFNPEQIKPHFIVQIKDNPVIAQRIEGFRQQLGTAYQPTIILTNDNPDEAVEAISQALSQASGHVRIFASNGTTADFTLTALKKLNRSATMVTFDITSPMAEAIVNEKIIATAAQDTYGMGYTGVKALYNLQSQPVQYLDTKIINLDNIAKPETANYLNGITVPSIPERKIDRTLMTGTYVSAAGERLGKYPQNDFATITFVSEHEFIIGSNDVLNPMIGKNTWSETTCKFGMTGDSFSGSVPAQPGVEIKGDFIELTATSIIFDMSIYINGKRVHMYRQVGTKSTADFSRTLLGTWEEFDENGMALRHTYNADGTCTTAGRKANQLDWEPIGAGHYYLRGNHLAINTVSIPTPEKTIYTSGLILFNNNNMSLMGVDNVENSNELKPSNELYTRIKKN